MTVDTCRKLSEHPRIVGLKDATGNVSFTARVSAACGSSLPIYSGNDDMITPILALGGLGVVSVVSNIFPELMARLCHAWRSGEHVAADHLQKSILPLCDALFCEVNPIPVKAAMAICGYCQKDVRLPLSPASETLCQRLKECLALGHL